MRLLFFSNVYPSPLHPQKGTFNRSLCEALTSQHGVDVISPISWLDERRGRAGAIPATRYTVAGGMRISFPRFYYTPGIFRARFDRFMWRSVRATVTDRLQVHRPDAVVSYWAHPDGAVATRVARMAGVPSIVMVGGSDVLLLARDRARRESMVRSLMAADAVVTVSGDLKQRTVELGVPAERVHVVYRGVDRTRFSPGAMSVARKSLGIDLGRPLLLWVGRMEPVKGLDVLLGACVELKKQGLGFQLRLIGDGTCRTALERQSQRAGLGDYITFRGAAEQSELATWYRAADLTVLPSYSEGVPNVLLESICCGAPFVASGVGGIPEIADPRHDTLVPPGDPEALAAAIAGALTRERASTSREFVPLSWDDSAEALSAVIARQVARGRPFATASAAARRPLGPSRIRQFVRRGLAATMPSNRFLVCGPRDSGQIFLTFDDGPHPEHTPRLLDVLAELDVKATFFVVGRQVEQHPDIVRRIHAEGHALGNHTYFHFAPAEVGTRDFLREVERCGRLVEGITGQSCELVRPPQGKLTLGKLAGLWRARKTIVLWNVDPKDYSRRSSRELCQWFARGALDAGDIVLLHDCHSHAGGAVPELVDFARRRGLDFGPLHRALHGRAELPKESGSAKLLHPMPRTSS